MSPVLCLRLQYNRNGLSQERLIAVDDKRGQLLNLDKRLRVNKRIPLVHLVQIEKNVIDPRHLSVVFSSTGALREPGCVSSVGFAVAV